MVMELDCSCAIFIKETEYQYGQGDGLASGLEIGLEIEVGSRQTGEFIRESSTVWTME